MSTAYCNGAPCPLCPVIEIGKPVHRWISAVGIDPGKTQIPPGRLSACGVSKGLKHDCSKVVAEEGVVSAGMERYEGGSQGINFRSMPQRVRRVRIEERIEERI